MAFCSPFSGECGFPERSGECQRRPFDGQNNGYSPPRGVVLGAVFPGGSDDVIRGFGRGNRHHAPVGSERIADLSSKCSNPGPRKPGTRCE